MMPLRTARCGSAENKWVFTVQVISSILVSLRHYNDTYKVLFNSQCPYALTVRIETILCGQYKDNARESNILSGAKFVQTSEGVRKCIFTFDPAKKRYRNKEKIFSIDATSPLFRQTCFFFKLFH